MQNVIHVKGGTYTICVKSTLKMHTFVLVIQFLKI